MISSGSAPPELAEKLYRRFAVLLRAEWPQIAEGVFGAMMQVSLTNDGPVTLLLEREAAAVARTAPNLSPAWASMSSLSVLVSAKPEDPEVVCTLRI